MQLGAMIAHANGRHVVRGVAYHPHNWVLQPMDQSMLAA